MSSPMSRGVWLVALVTILAAGCVRYGFVAEQGSAVEETAPADSPLGSRELRHEYGLRDGPGSDGPRPDVLFISKTQAGTDTTTPLDAPVPLDTQSGTVVPVTKDNDICGTAAVADFSAIATQPVIMSFDPSGAALDHAPAFYCAGMVDLVVRILNNPLTNLMVLGAGGSGDLVLIGSLTAGASCPVTGWAITSGGGGFSLDLLPLGSSYIVVCRSAATPFTITWTPL